MGTILFHNIIFGPIKSRRLGNSLGVNLLPKDGKLCSFDCIYCECGWNKDGRADNVIPPKEAVFQQMSETFARLKAEGTPVDTVTFSGNGEPTLHPDFAEIIDYTIKMRDEYFPAAAISVLSNATQLHRPDVREALMKVTNPILKIDSGLEEYIRIIDQPVGEYSLQKVIENIRHFGSNFVLQTMFLKGNVGGRYIDCTAPESTEPWVRIALDLKPREVMMYTLDRETPAKGLEKVTAGEMEEIAAPLKAAGIKVQIRG